MTLLYAKSMWEEMGGPLEPFLRRARDDGFSATEIWLRTLREPPDEVEAMHREYGLALVAQTLTEGDTPDDHLRSLEAQTERAAACRPVLLNHHAGRDRFSFEGNLRVYRRLLEVGEETGLEVVAETHRGRPTYSLPGTVRLLDALPALRLTLDVSHWMVVHESDLGDQAEALATAVARTRHVHARVGHEEGSQVSDPRAAVWEGHVRRHVEVWQAVVDANVAADAERLTITPEFGPPPYLPTDLRTGEPAADPWALNVWMRDRLEGDLDVPTASR
ncbi:sugar phosphate isomerase/epimerase family protein [Rubrivirga sp.]|uniref:sugar phosphate isomerase/epimerase family protein n=1 Tax=Rubrivirga sp. TaxID=1885344 RepID=UPI003B52D633